MERETILDVATLAEFDRQIAKLGPSRLSREAGVRTNRSLELWTMRNFLLRRRNENALEFPLKLVSRDRPDFLLEVAGGDWGFEVTSATFPAVEIARTLAHVLDVEIYSEDGLARRQPIVKHNKSEISDYLLKDHGRHIGYQGDAVEKEIRDLLDNCITQKLQSLNNPGFDHFSSNALLIYENSGLPVVHWQRVDVASLRRRNANAQRVRFDKIIVISGEDLIEMQ